jgi:cytidylate kinase
MRRKQRECAEFGSLVMEGRDIGSNIFPETDFKFWLDASPDERARRRRAQGVEDDLVYRDRQDSQRAAAPLMPGLGARRVDTTGHSASEVIALIAKEVAAAMALESSRSGSAPSSLRAAPSSPWAI